METSNEHDSVVVDPVEQPKGKAPDQSSAGVAMQQRVCLWLGKHGINSNRYLFEKLLTEAHPLVFIPFVTSLDVSRRRRTEDRIRH